jgi:hypothetical protein
MKRWVVFLVWVGGTLVAIVAIGENLYLGLAVGIVSGVVFGILSWLAFERRTVRSGMWNEVIEDIAADERG